MDVAKTCSYSPLSFQLDVAKNRGGVKFPKMPEGWNPSDDSEDEYTPAATRNTAQKRVGDDEEETAGKLQMKKVKVNQSGAEGTASNIPLPPVKATLKMDVN